jgi:hypothetical protein
VAFYQGRYPAAVAKAREAFSHDPSLYEAKVLEGDALVAMGMACMDTDPEAFVRFLREAGVPYSVALGMARSDPALIYAEAARRSELAKYAYFCSDGSEGNYDQLQRLLDQVLVVDPDAAYVYVAKVRLATAYAAFQGEHGRDPFPVLNQAIAWCEQADYQTQGRLFVSTFRGEAYNWKAYFESERGLASSQSLENAFLSFQEAASLKPGDAWVHQRIAEVCSRKAEQAVALGGNPQVFLDKGMFHMKEAFRLMESRADVSSASDLPRCLGNWRREHGRAPGLPVRIPGRGSVCGPTAATAVPALRSEP